MIQELNPSRCQEIRQILRDLKRNLKKTLSGIVLQENILREARRDLPVKRQRLQEARRREVQAMSLNIFPNPIAGTASMVLGVGAAIEVTRLKEEVNSLEIIIANTNANLTSTRRDRTSFEANLSELSREGNRLNCVL